MNLLASFMNLAGPDLIVILLIIRFGLLLILNFIFIRQTMPGAATMDPLF